MVDVKIPSLEQETFDYNGIVQTPEIVGFDSSYMIKSGTLSGTSADEYEIYIGLKEGYQWDDGTVGDITLKWKINAITVDKPIVAPLEYTYDGSGAYNSSYYKLPSITGYDKNIMSQSGTGLTKQYKAGEYLIAFTLKDPASCSWSDGTSADYTATWVIKTAVIPIPVVTSEDYTYDGKLHSALVSGYSPEIMTRIGHIGNYAIANNYSITYALRDPGSCAWSDGTTTNKTAYWKINKQIVYIDKPFLTEDQSEFTYDGTTHTPVITNRDNNKMNVSGTLSSIAANTEENPFWEINIALNTATNYIYKWNVENEDDKSEENQTAPVALKWVVNKGYFTPPSLEQHEYPFTASTITPDIQGYNSKVMERSGTYSATNANDYTVVYTLKDPASAEWDDGEGGNSREINWKILGVKVDVPQLTETEVPVAVSSFQVVTRTAPLDSYPSNLITVFNNSGTSSVGTHTVTFRLRYPDSCTWNDENGGTDDRTAEWKLLPITVKYPKVKLEPQKFTYDGHNHTTKLLEYIANTPYYYRHRIIGGYERIYYRAMTYDGVLSGTAAKVYTVTVYPYSATEGAYKNGCVDVFWEEDDTNTPLELTWEIEKAEFTVPVLSPSVIAYDGKSHSVTAIETGFDSYVMTRTSESVLTATAVGEYFVTYSLKDKTSAYWSDGTVEDKIVKWKITENEPIAIPTVTDTEKTYNGSSQAPTISPYDTGVISVSGKTSAVGAGTYTVTFSLKDPSSACWSDGTTEPKSFSWAIAKKVIKVNKPELVTSEFTYTGSTITPNLTGTSYIVRDGDSSAEKAGDYVLVAKLEMNNNYEYRWVDDTVADINLPWKINIRILELPTIDKTLFNYHVADAGAYRVYYYSQPELFGYDPAYMTSEGVTQYRLSNSQSNSQYYANRYFGNYQWAVNNYYIKVEFKDRDSCRWSDGSNTAIEFEWSIAREVVLLKKPSLNPDSFEYDGTEKKPDIINDVENGITKTGTFSATAVGNYNITFELYRKFDVDDNYDYRWEDNTIIPASVTRDWHITKSTSLDIPTISPESFDYDGTSHIPALIGFDSNTMAVSGNAGQTNVGEYEIVFSLKDPTSACWSDGTTGEQKRKWKINAVKIDKPTFAPDFLQYDGEAHTVRFDGVDDENSFVVSGFDPNTMSYSGDISKTEVGHYKVVISLKDTVSSTWNDGSTASVEFSWEICKKTVLLDKPHLQPDFWTFDGDMHAPEIVGWKTPGMYVKNDSVTSTSHVGKHTITLCLTEDNNITYLWGDAIENAVGGELSLEWEIGGIEGGLEKPYLIGSPFTYDKQTHTIGISDYDTSLISQSGVTSAWKDGTYTVTFTLKYPDDVTWSDGTNAPVVREWEIVKPKVAVPTPKLVPNEFIFDSKYHSPEITELADVVTVKSNIAQWKIGNYGVTVGLNYDTCNSLITYTWDDGTTGDITIPWTIIRNVNVPIPTISGAPFVYSGLEQSVTVNDFNGDLVEQVGNILGTAAGTYTAIFRLKYPDATTWTDGTLTDKEISWVITPAEFEKPSVTDLVFTYDGTEHTPTISEYNTCAILASGVKSAVDADKYTITFSLKDKNSSAWIGGGTDDFTVEWYINKVKLEKPYIQNNEYVYNGGEQKPSVKGFDENTMRKSGTESAVDANVYHIYIDIKSPQNYTWSDGTSGRLDLDWTIGKRPVDKPCIEPDTYTYTGNTVSPIVLGFRSVAMEYGGTSDRHKTDVGDYEIIVKLKDNYKWSDDSEGDAVLSWHITKILVALPDVENLLFEYDGTKHAPAIGEYDVNAVSRGGIDSATNAGGYQIIFSLRDAEHCQWETLTSDDYIVDWEITKIVVAKPVGVTLNFVYNGGEHAPVISGIDENHMSFRGGAPRTNAGIYTCTVTLKNKENYIWNDGTSADIDFIWTIARKSVAVPYLDPDEFEYNTNPHSPVIRNFDATIMEIVQSESVTSAVNVGEYKIVVLLGERVSLGDGNYYYLRNYEWETGDIDNITLTWRIIPKNIDYPILTEWEFTYDGEKHSPRASGCIVGAMLPVGTASAVNAGDYEIGFHLVDTTNYRWADGVVDSRLLPWKINRAFLKKTDLPIQNPVLVYNGAEQTPTWENYDPNKLMFNETKSATNAGTYIAYFAPSCNYIWEDGTLDAVPVNWVIEKLGLNIPEQYNKLYYNGEEREPIWLVTYHT